MMERVEKALAPSTLRKKNEPTFVPEWLKTATGGSIINGGSSHIFGPSPNSDYRAAGVLSRNRLSVNLCDDSHTTIFTDRTLSSYHRSSSTNGSHSQGKVNSVRTQFYSSYGRSHHDRDWDKDIDFYDKKKSINFENGFDSITNISQNDAFMRSQVISGNHSESWSRKSGSDLTSALSSGSNESTLNKTSFEREFPSLVGGDRLGPLDVGRVTSPSISNAAQSFSLGSSTTIGGDGWTSALAKVPVIIGGSGPLLSSVKQTVPASVSSMVPSTSGLNMAETLAQVPRAGAVSQLPFETQKLEELAMKQSRQLVPMTPSMPKALVLASLEKPKPKGFRCGVSNTLSKVEQQSSAQLVNNTVTKTSQIRSFQVLNHKKNAFSPPASDNPSLTNAVRVSNHSAADTPLLNSPNKVRADGKASGLPLTMLVEKRAIAQQNRGDFFNSLRKMSKNNLMSVRSSFHSSTLEKPDDQIIGAPSSDHTWAQDTSVLGSGLVCQMENDNCIIGAVGACEGLESSLTSNGEKDSCLDPAEEVRLLRLFGWKENAGEEDEALTAEEIDAFIEEYQRLRPSSKFCHHSLRLTKPRLPEAEGGSGLCPSEYRAEERS